MAGAPLRSVAVVGCGWAGERHARAFRSIGVGVAWAIDPSVTRRQALADATGARPAADADAALADPAVDAAVLCLPHRLHAPEAVRWLEASRHVLVEKPLATTLAEADAMIGAADRAGRVLMVAENVWFDPALLRIRELLGGGSIGAVSLVQISRDVWTTDEDLQARPWYGAGTAEGGGIMMAGGVHDIEKARLLVGEIAGVYAVRAPQRLLAMEADDTSVAVLRFVPGAVGVLVESFSARIPATASGGELHRLRIDGAAGSILHDRGGPVTVFTIDGNRREAAAERSVAVDPVDTFAAEAEHFARAVATGEEPVTSGRSQRRALELVLAAHRSMAAEDQPGR